MVSANVSKDNVSEGVRKAGSLGFRDKESK